MLHGTGVCLFDWTVYIKIHLAHSVDGMCGVEIWFVTTVLFWVFSIHLNNKNVELEINISLRWKIETEIKLKFEETKAKL